MAKAKATDTPPPLPVIPDLTPEQLREYQAWLEDKTVRAVRESSYCEQAEIIMRRVFGPPLDGVAYRDSDGVTCRYDQWRDREGYNRHGFDRDGFDRDGYNAAGRDAAGFDREGLDANGVHKDDPSRFRFDKRGYDQHGFDGSGRDRNGHHRDAVDSVLLYFYDAQGYDRDGYDRNGNERGTGRYDRKHDMVDYPHFAGELAVKWGLLVNVDGLLVKPEAAPVEVPTVEVVGTEETEPVTVA